MNMNRRQFITTLGAAGVALTATRCAQTTSPPAQHLPSEPKVGMCDWNLGTPCDPDMIPTAREANLQGIQVSVGSDPDRMLLRDPAIRQKYLDLGSEHGIEFHSVAAGGILNRIPLKSEPQSAVYVIDAVEAAAALGATNILIAFFGNGDLRLQNEAGEFRDLSTGPYSSFELDRVGVQRVIDALRQIVPRAEDAGIILGLENTLTAEQNLEIIDEIGSDMVQVYYDVGNSTGNNYDVPGEIRMLGSDRICEIHLKDRNTRVLGTEEGSVDFDAVAEACRDIAYDKWYVLETSGRRNRFMEDTRANVAFVKERFAREAAG